MKIVALAVVIASLSLSAESVVVSDVPSRGTVEIQDLHLDLSTKLLTAKLVNNTGETWPALEIR